MKIIFAQTNYPSFLDSFYKKNPEWKKVGYKKVIERWGNEFFGNSNFYSKTFNKIGWEAIDLLVDDKNSQQLWCDEHKFPLLELRDSLTNIIPYSIKIRLGLIDNWIFKALLRQVKYYKPDVIYFHHLGLLSADQLKKIKKHARLLVGQIASPLPKNIATLKQFDLIVSSFPHYVKLLKKEGINSEYNPLCADSSLPKLIKSKFRNKDVVYVGGFTPHHSEGTKVLEKLAKNVPVEFWGYGENFLSPLSPIRKTFHGQAWGKEMYKIFSESKIVINRHINVSKDYANNLRLFEATIMGSLLITDNKKNIKDFFIPGKEIVVYENANDLIRKVKYYLSHDKERELIAKAGQKRTLKDHTYSVRMKNLEKILLKYL